MGVWISNLAGKNVSGSYGGGGGGCHGEYRLSYEHGAGRKESGGREDGISGMAWGMGGFVLWGRAVGSRVRCGCL